MISDLHSGRLDKVEDGVPELDLVAVLGDDPHVEEHVRRPQRRVQPAAEGEHGHPLAERPTLGDLPPPRARLPLQREYICMLPCQREVTRVARICAFIPTVLLSFFCLFLPPLLPDVGEKERIASFL